MRPLKDFTGNFHQAPRAMYLWLTSQANIDFVGELCRGHDTCNMDLTGIDRASKGGDVSSALRPSICKIQQLKKMWDALSLNNLQVEMRIMMDDANSLVHVSKSFSNKH